MSMRDYPILSYKMIWGMHILSYTELRGLDSDQEYPAPKAGVLPLNDPAALYRKDLLLK